MLDPCCGSGHFLVAGFDLLVRLRMAEESLSVTDAIDAVLRDNLHGLEIDPRCTQIAAFNLAIAAWKLGGYRPLPPMNIACTGVGPRGKREDWLKLADDVPLRDRGPIRLGLDGLYEAFEHAPTLGSLIDPTLIRMVGAADYETLAPTLAAAAHVEAASSRLPEESRLEPASTYVTAQGLLKAGELLVGPPGGYTLVITNVPYLGRGKQDPILQAWAGEHQPDAKADLATMFISRAMDWLSVDAASSRVPDERGRMPRLRGGTLAVVSPQNWLFLTRYRHLRARLLKDDTWNSVVRLGGGAFETIGGAVVNVALISLTRGESSDTHMMAGVDASSGKTPEDKAVLLRSHAPAGFRMLSQAGQAKNPEARITVEESRETARLESNVISMRGIVSGDGDYWIRMFWEVKKVGGRWRFEQSTVTGTALYSGRDHIIDWSTSGRGMLRPGTKNEAYGRDGVAVAQTGELYVTLYTGELYDNNTGPLVPLVPTDLLALWCFCASTEFRDEVRSVDQALKVTNASFLRVPFDLAYWQSVAAEKYPNGLPEPESDDPTQWLFHGWPQVDAGSGRVRSDEEKRQDAASTLQVAVARLAGYRWPAELDASMRLSERARALVRRCDELQKFVDDDGILPIPAMRGEPPLAERLTELLAAASLDDWLRNHFFEQHCKLFHHRPFIWHVWDGRRDGFNVLVNYHALASRSGFQPLSASREETRQDAASTGYKALDSLTHAYLGDWIGTQAADARAGKTGADLRLAAAQALQRKLELILAGEKPYDIFVRWKPLKDQPIGWNPDLNDGVRMNIRPFVTADVLRKTPNIKWGKDRGKDPESAPWFKVFNGERINDHHLNLEEKRKGRG